MVFAQPSSFLTHPQHLSHWITPFFLKHFSGLASQAPLGLVLSHLCSVSSSPPSPGPLECHEGLSSELSPSWLHTVLKSLIFPIFKDHLSIHNSQLSISRLVSPLNSRLCFQSHTAVRQMAELASQFPLCPLHSRLFQPQVSHLRKHHLRVFSSSGTKPPCHADSPVLSLPPTANQPASRVGSSNKTYPEPSSSY